MAQDFNTETDFDMNEIEKRARLLRAEVTRDIGKAIASFFSRLIHLGAAKPVATSS